MKAAPEILKAACIIFFIPLSVIAQQSSVGDSDSIQSSMGITPGPPGNVAAVDEPDDRGGAVNVSWDKASGDDENRLVTGYLVYRSEAPEGEFKMVSLLPPGSTDFTDSDSLKNGVEYYYKVASVYRADTLNSAVSQPAVPEPQWFKKQQLPVFIFMLLFSAATVALILYARRGRSLYVRPIAGIDAVDDAIGRATEMGKPILFVPGLGEASRVATIAAFTILARVAKKVAEYQTRIIVPNYDPVVMTICQEVVKEAYSSAGRPEAFDPKDVYFVTQDQFPYTASVNGTMLREKPATNFYMGMFYAESLILAETGFITGSIQIAGTDQLIQIPFFVVACDYTLMGEELYAASAYLSQEPQQLGTLKAQDWGKLAAVFLMIAGAIVYLFSTGIGDIFMAWIRSE